MGVVESIFAGDSTLKDPAEWLHHALGGRMTASGQRVNATTAMKLAPYYAALRAISEDVAKIPFKVFKNLQPRGKEVQPLHPVHRLLTKSPNRDMTPIAFRETMTHWALGWGGGIAEIERDGAATPVALWPIHPSRVELDRSSSRDLLYNIRTDDIKIDGRERPHVVTLPARDVLHIHGLSIDGVDGYSILAMASETLGLGLAVQTFGASFFGRGAHVGGVLEHPKTISDGAWNRLRESWDDEHVGAENTGKTMIAEEGMKYTKRGIPPDEAQFLETQEFTVETFARWFRIPPHKLQALKRSTFSNIESQSLEYVTDTLLPWFVRWEQEGDRKLLADDEGDLFTKHVVQALLRGDMGARSVFYTKLFLMGALSPNDIREFEDLNPSGPAGDQYYVPMNLAPIESVADGTVRSSKGSADGPRTPVKRRDAEAIKKAHARIFADVATRLVAKEKMAALRACKRHEGDASAFAEWLGKFYGEHESQFVGAFTAPAEALVELLAVGSAVPDYSRVRVLLERYAATYAGNHRALLELAFRHKTIAVLCQEWEINAPGMAAQELTDQLASIEDHHD